MKKVSMSKLNPASTLLLTCAVVLSGCTSAPTASPRTPSPTPSMTANATSSPTTSPTSTTTVSPTPMPSGLNKTEKGTNANMTKTIADFDKIKATEATLHTSKGEITFTLYRDQAPLTTANFLHLSKSGFYNGIKFHRIIADFMAQVGDPLSKDDSKKSTWGTGGPGYTIADEFGKGLKHDSEGVVSMANAGPNTGGSQFFITYEATPWLDGKHAIFGKVTKGMDVLRQLSIGDEITSVTYR